MSVPKRKKIGWRAEKRLVKFLSVLGKVRSGKSKECSGQWGSPDVKLETANGIYGIESKSIYGFTKQGVGSIYIYSSEWYSLLEFCEKNGFKPRVLMEIRATRPNIRILLMPGYVTERLKNKEAVHITVWQALHNGIIIRNQDELLAKWE